MNKLTKEFYLQDTITVAKELLGCFLVRKTDEGEIAGRICETEAYIGSIDKACHAYEGKRTNRTEPLFLEGGVAYVYLIYGMYYCFNVVTEEIDFPSAVLIRAAEVFKGKEIASRNRYNKSRHLLTTSQKENLSNGPGKLCRAFDIDKSLNTESLLDNTIYICDQYGGKSKSVKEIAESKRIGIDYAEEAKDFLWRFVSLG